MTRVMLVAVSLAVSLAAGIVQTACGQDVPPPRDLDSLQISKAGAAPKKTKGDKKKKKQKKQNRDDDRRDDDRRDDDRRDDDRRDDDRRDDDDWRNDDRHPLHLPVPSMHSGTPSHAASEHRIDADCVLVIVPNEVRRMVWQQCWEPHRVKKTRIVEKVIQKKCERKIYCGRYYDQGDCAKLGNLRN